MYFRIVTYNIEFGGVGRVDALYSVLAHVNADVVALTEADDPAVVATLAERLQLHHVWAEGSGDRHIATLSRFPIEQMALQLFVVFKLAIPRLLKAGYTDCFRALHPNEDGFTFMPGNRTTRYDYIMADPRMAPALRSCRVVDEIEAVEEASDHYPLLAEFALDKSAG